MISESIWQDIRFGARAVSGKLGFSSVVILTLGLAIGATTAIFSVVDGILLRPLPYPQPDRMVSVWADYTRRDGPVREWLSYPNFHDLRQERSTFQEVAIYTDWSPTLTGGGEPELVQAVNVTAGMFARVLQQSPALGRGLTLEDDEPGAESVALLSHDFWVRRFGADPDILGEAVMLNDLPYVVIGIMPQGFRPPFIAAADLWTPMQMNETQFAGSRSSARFLGLARLSDGVTMAQARARADVLGEQLEAAYARANTGVGYALFPLHADLVQGTVTPLWLLMGAVSFVLLIACVNIANLLLARSVSRRAELAVRAAMGAGRGRLLRQLLTESAVLAGLGGALGLAISVAGIPLLVGLAPAGTPRLDTVSLDLRVLLFAAVITLIATLAFGLLPALRGARTDLHGALKAGGRGGDPAAHGRSLRNALVVGQMALAIMLLVGAGLMIRTIQALRDVDLGYQPAGVLAVRVNLPPSHYQDATTRSTFFRTLESRLSAAPGVVAVGANSSLPLSGNNGDVDFVLEGQPVPDPGQENIMWIRRTTPGYFEAVGLDIVRGRAFTLADDASAQRVLIVNETLANRYFPDRDPIGQRINVNGSENPVWREIVGVAADVKNFGVTEDSRNAAYFPYHQIPNTRMMLAVKTDGDPMSILPTVREAMRDIDPSLVAANAAPLGDFVSTSLQTERFVASLLGLFAGVAFFLAAVGLYGVVSYGVNQRLREMGLRLALGASGGAIRRLVMGRSMVLAAGGVVLGLAGAIAVTRVMAGLLFGVSPNDPATMTAVAAALLSVAGVASLIPAERAVRVDPIAVLKEE
jgi:putative ABC transport system permease protein